MTRCDLCGKTGHDAPACPQSTGAEGSMDLLVQAASVPNLAALIQRGKDQGLIKPQQGYVST